MIGNLTFGEPIDSLFENEQLIIVLRACMSAFIGHEQMIIVMLACIHRNMSTLSDVDKSLLE